MEDIKTKTNRQSISPNKKNEICKVLIIEDEPSLLAMYKLRFEKDEFEVYTANDGQPGLEMVKKYHPDIVLLDVVLNNTDGFYVLKKIKSDKQTSSIPVIIISNLGTTKDMQYGLKSGADGYLIKAHTTPAQLVDKVKNTLNII